MCDGDGRFGNHSIRTSHYFRPHQIKQPLSKIAVNERAVTALQDNVSERIRK